MDEVTQARLLLQLPLDFDEAQLKQQYRQQAKALHPDRNDHPEAHTQFQELTIAYETLQQVLRDRAQAASIKHSDAADNPAGTRVTVTRRSSPTQSAPPPEPPPLTPEQQLLRRNAEVQLEDLRQKGQWVQALLVVDELLRALPHDARARRLKGWVYFNYAQQLIAQNKIDRARQYLKGALKWANSDAELWRRIETIYTQLERRGRW
ncbi:J domain-containing protein [Synechococcus elongatus]|uniref:J domain-containing protein n=1 Tax=Synechococcus elongatus PCC 11801 TaxID=2219813 RepID=A0AAN1QQ33_SYNEL|nr:J domain-containing protein [Synechococcus elongatus]AZB73500.1 J domain-containing protein [Synechococcus elongatus PCC 11801]